MSSPVLVFLYFFLFGMNIIAYCFLISVLFNKAKTASTAGVVLFFMAFFAYFGGPCHFLAILLPFEP